MPLDPIWTQRLFYSYLCSNPQERTFSLGARTLARYNRRILRDDFVLDEEMQRFHQLAFCYRDTRNVMECFQRILGGLPEGINSNFSFSPQGRRICERLVEYSEESLEQHINRLSFTARVNRDYVGNPGGNGLQTREWSQLNQIAQFYEEQMDNHGGNLNYLLRYFHAPELYQAHLDAYQNRSITQVEGLNPPFGRGAEHWVRHDLRIPGYRYMVPVLLPRDLDYRWNDTEEHLRIVFELFKFFIPPTFMDRILRPGDGRPDFILVIAPRPPLSPAFIRDATLSQWVNNPRASGFANAVDNHLMIRDYHLSQFILLFETAPNGALRPRVSPLLAGIFFHEFAHMLDYNILNHESRARLDAWRLWSQRQYELNQRSYYAPVPSRTLRDERAYFYNAEGNYVTQDALEQHRPYALTNNYEFFAELATEYIMAQLGRYLGTNPYNTQRSPEERQQFLAREAVMRDFFGAQALHPEAFNPSNIQRRYREQGIDMNVENTFRPLATLEARACFAAGPQGSAAEISVQRRTFAASRLNYFFGPLLGIQSSGQIYAGGEFGISSPVRRLQVDFHGMSAYRFSHENHPGSLMMGVGARMIYYPFSDGYSGVHFTGGARVMIDREHLQPYPLFLLGIGWTPSLTLPQGLP